MSIGEKIKKLRKKEKLTLEELGEKIGLKKSTISKYEKNEINIPSDKIAKIAKALNTSIAYLIESDKQVEFSDTSMLSSEQKEELNTILATNNIMFFKGNNQNKEAVDRVKESITKIYLQYLKNNGEI